MKAVFVLLVACLAAVSARYMTNEVKYADDDFIVKQKAIFEILMNVWQPEIHNTYYDLAGTWKFEDFKDKFGGVDTYDDFMHFYNFGFLGMNEIFAPYQTDHNKQMLAVFNMFYFAKDWDTFYHFMSWSRYHINPGMFVHALTMAVLHRDDFAGIVLPAIYEINPYYFFNSFLISKAQKMRMQGTTKMHKEGDLYSYTFKMNYTSYYVDTNPDSKLAYFMEGLLR